MSVRKLKNNIQNYINHTFQFCIMDAFSYLGKFMNGSLNTFLIVAISVFFVGCEQDAEVDHPNLLKSQ